MQEHPRCTEFIAEHCKPGSEIRLLHFHEDLAAGREHRINAFCFCGGVKTQGQIGASHWLGRWNVGSHEDRTANLNTRVQNFGLPVIWNVWIRLLFVRLHAGDLSAEVLLVEAERLSAIARVVDVDIKFHSFFVFVAGQISL